jgi:hypothetical protein
MQFSLETVARIYVGGRGLGFAAGGSDRHRFECLIRPDGIRSYIAPRRFIRSRRARAIRGFSERKPAWHIDSHNQQNEGTRHEISYDGTRDGLCTFEHVRSGSEFSRQQLTVWQPHRRTHDKRWCIWRRDEQWHNRHNWHNWHNWHGPGQRHAICRRRQQFRCTHRGRSEQSGYANRARSRAGRGERALTSETRCLNAAAGSFLWLIRILPKAGSTEPSE